QHGAAEYERDQDRDPLDLLLSHGRPADAGGRASAGAVSSRACTCRPHDQSANVCQYFKTSQSPPLSPSPTRVTASPIREAQRTNLASRRGFESRRSHRVRPSCRVSDLGVSTTPRAWRRLGGRTSPAREPLRSPNVAGPPARVGI